MKFVFPTVTPVNESNLQKKIEKCYRICYKSEDRMKEDSTGFLTAILNREGNKHYSPLEHARVQLTVDARIAYALEKWQEKRNSRFIIIDFWHKDQSGAYIILVTGNLRSFREFVDDYDPTFDRNDVAAYDLADAQIKLANVLHSVVPAIIPKIESTDNLSLSTCTYIGEDPNYQTFHIVTTRDVLQQIARHRSLSLSVESTRFNNYTKKGFEYCIPIPYYWADANWDMINSTELQAIEFPNEYLKVIVTNAYNAEASYREMMRIGCAPEEARILLPGGLKTELYATGTLDAWDKYLALRLDEHADPLHNYIAKYIESCFNDMRTK